MLCFDAAKKNHIGAAALPHTNFHIPAQQNHFSHAAHASVATSISALPGLVADDANGVEVCGSLAHLLKAGALPPALPFASSSVASGADPWAWQAATKPAAST